MKEPIVEEKIKEIIIEQLDINKELITPESYFIKDLGADSLDIVELVMEFEDAFDLNIPDEDAEKIQTVGDSIKYIEERAGKKWKC